MDTRTIDDRLRSAIEAAWPGVAVEVVAPSHARPPLVLYNRDGEALDAEIKAALGERHPATKTVRAEVEYMPLALAWRIGLEEFD